MAETEPRILVVGGGISGLSTAYFLLRALERDGVRADVSVVEASSRAGGTLGSELVEGFLFERGPNGFLDNAPDTLELVRDLNLEDALATASPAARKRYLFRGGALEPLPGGPLELLRSRLLSFRGKVRLLAEPLAARAALGEEDSVASFGRRRLGREVVGAFLDPLVTGIYAGDVERLSLRSAFPSLARMERDHGSLFRALKSARRNARETSGVASPTPLFGSSLKSFHGGLASLLGALVTRLGSRLRTSTPVEAVRPGDGRFTVRFRDGRQEDTERLVIALPSPRAANLFAARHPELARELELIPYAPVAVVCLGYRRESVEHPLDGYGLLVPREEGLRTLGVIWTSSIFPMHAPEGHVSLRAMVGGARDPEAVDLSAAELAGLVEREMRGVLGLRGEPVVQRVYRYTQGIPQYNVGHARRLERIEDRRRTIAGLYLTGNAYRGVGLNDCVREARRLATEVAQEIRRSA